MQDIGKMRSVSILISLLSLLLFASNLNARKELREDHQHMVEDNNVLRLPTMGGDQKQNNDVNPHVHVHAHGGNSSTIFFTVNYLKLANKWSIDLPPLALSTSSRLLSREEAESIPFSYEKLPYLLRYFSLSPESPHAKAVKDTLRACEDKPVTGETKFCATSFESMLDFVGSVFGSEFNNFKALKSTYLTRSKTMVQNYTIIRAPKEISTPKLVGCHPFPYPYTVFYCHTQTTNKAFRISLAGENGDRIEAIAVCHFDTSEWDPHHLAFLEIGSKPGLTEVCHFAPADNMVWVPDHVQA